MDSESMSRSSTKDLSAVTSAASTPATSSTISASPFWMSSLLTENPFLLASPAGWSHRSLGLRSRQPDDLSRVGQAGPEADEQRHVTAAHLSRRAHVVQREGDRSGRGVAGVHDVTRDHEVF